MKEFYNTTTPYKIISHSPIQYGVCRDYSHISRYRKLRQVTHNIDSIDNRHVSLETPNAFESNLDVLYYKVPEIEENRLDIIDNRFLGSPTYSWVIAYLNGITDGFTVYSGQTIVIPKSFYSLFQNGELLSNVAALSLNLGIE